MDSASHDEAGQDSLKLTARFESLQFEAAPELSLNGAPGQQPESHGQPLAPLGATRVDDSAAATGFHTNQKAVCAGAANLGGLVSAFHFENPKGLNDSSSVLRGA